MLGFDLDGTGRAIHPAFRVRCVCAAAQNGLDVRVFEDGSFEQCLHVRKCRMAQRPVDLAYLAPGSLLIGGSDSFLARWHLESRVACVLGRLRCIERPVFSRHRATGVLSGSRPMTATAYRLSMPPWRLFESKRRHTCGISSENLEARIGCMASPKENARHMAGREVDQT